MNNRLNADRGPWYREPWPWLLALGPVTVIIAGFITAYLAVISNDGLVEDDYYKQGLTVNQRTARDQRAGELAIEADLVVGGSGDRIRALLRGNEEFQLPEALTLRIVHPTRPGFDQAVVLRSEGGGVYAGVLTPVQGRWHLALEDDRQEWRLVGDWMTGQQPRLTTAAPATAAPTNSYGR